MLIGMTEAVLGLVTAWICLSIEQLNMGQWAATEESCRHVLALALRDVAYQFDLTFDPVNVQALILVQAGTLSPTAPAAVTPEPSSLAQLGTGILGVFGVTKRRFV